MVRLILGLLILGLVVFFTVESQTVAVAEPAFTLVMQHGDIEERDYPALVVAEVTVPGDPKAAIAAGFRILAGYIFGGNARQQKIAMTAPVVQAPANPSAAEAATYRDGLWIIRFIMPDGLARDALPRPDNPQVRLATIAPSRFAVIRFSGLARSKIVAEKTAALRDFIAAQGMRAIGPPALARYDPPWKLWFLRRNEVMIPIAAGTAP